MTIEHRQRVHPDKRQPWEIAMGDIQNYHPYASRAIFFSDCPNLERPDQPSVDLSAHHDLTPSCATCRVVSTPTLRPLCVHSCSNLDMVSTLCASSHFRPPVHWFRGPEASNSRLAIDHQDVGHFKDFHPAPLVRFHDVGYSPMMTTTLRPPSPMSSCNAHPCKRPSPTLGFYVQGPTPTVVVAPSHKAMFTGEAINLRAKLDT